MARVGLVTRPTLTALIMLGALLASSGCAAAEQPTPPQPTPGSLTSPAAEPGLPHEIVEPILRDAEQRTGYSQDRFIVVPSVPATWPDSTMDCPQPGEEPVVGLVEGYVVVLRVEEPEATEVLLEYRVRADDGSFRFCEESFVPPPG